MKTLEDEKPKKEPKDGIADKKVKLIAKRDFVLYCPGSWGGDIFREIKAGDDISDIPIRFHDNLKTERVL